jgi:HEAT repeat protein/regulation of enolase protein 1 (concanavalin A-like superfamily)
MMMQKKPYVPMSLSAFLLGGVLIFSPTVAQAAPPDLTSAGVIAALKSNPGYSTRSYNETYNLGATGLRGWIYIDTSNPISGSHGLITAPSRQILVTVASAPGNAVLAVDDVILGAIAANSGAVPLFTSDCRKAFGTAVGNAEKTGAGTLRVKRWRAGATADVNIPMTIMGNYTATAPYSCPKSALTLANARNKLVGELLANSNFPELWPNYYQGAVNGLALLASVAPGDPNYATVQTRLQIYARSVAALDLQPEGMYMWSASYMGMFLSEYYLRTVADGTPDGSVLPGIKKFTEAIANAQSMYGTFGHGGADLKANGSLHGSVPPYGPINSVGIPANIAIVLGKKALVAGNQTINLEIDPAITRASNFFGYYVNKGGIPYGEHEPVDTAHASNGKDPMCAVLFGLQTGRPVETEYFTRMSVAGWIGREYGHTGQGFSYLWEAMGCNMGGPTAMAKYLENVRWQHDLARRTDGSFTYHGQEQYGGGATADGSYLGVTGYHGMNPTATHILTYALPLKRLFITGRNAIPANTLDATKVNNAAAAGDFKLRCTAYTTTQLIASLSDYDPVVRCDAAIELGKRSLTTTEVNTLLSMVNGTNTNGRMGACQTLGIIKNNAALPLLTQRLSDADFWVRSKAAIALRNLGTAASGQLTPMLTAFTANATDPNTPVWSDPLQQANGYLSNVVFDTLSANTIAASKSLLYPAMKAGLKQPDSQSRSATAGFAYGRLTFEDLTALAPDVVQCVTTTAQANTMFSMYPRSNAIALLGKYKIAEAVPLALDMQYGGGWNSNVFHEAGLDVLSSFGTYSRWTLPALRELALTRNSPKLTSTISNIDTSTSLPSGVTYLYPVVGTTSWGSGRVDTFIKGNDNNLYWKFWNGSAWSQYSSLNTAAYAGIGTTNWGVNRMDIFYTGSNGSMRHKWYTGSWSAEEDQGGVIIGSPGATSWANNRIDVLCRGTDNRLYWKYYNGSWSGWTSTGLGADVYSSPAVTDWGPNRLDVFYAGSNGSLRHKWYTGSWSNEEDLGGKMLGGPSAVAWNNNRIDVILRGTDNQLYWKYWNGSSWSGFNALGAFAYSDPTVSSRGDGQLDVFYKGANGAMKQKYYNLGAWSPEYDLGTPSFNGMAASASFASVVPSSELEAQSAPVVAASPAVTGLPAPWTINSIGSGMVSGSTSYSAGTASQSGSGTLGSTSDKLNFSYQTLSGDGQITAKISVLQNTGTLSGVGVMIRETLATNSKHVFMGMSGTNTYRTASRTTTGGIATSVNNGTGTVPNTWVKLVRLGNVITASRSSDGVTWILVGNTAVTMATNCYIGLAVSSGSDTILNTSQFSNFSITR